MPTLALRDTRFSNERLDAVGVEVLAVSELQRRVGARRLAGPERIEFFMLLVVAQGHGEHWVDFERIGLTRGRVVWVRPGQVQEWRFPAGFRGDVLLIEPAALQTTRGAHADAAMALLRLEEWPSFFDLDAAEKETCRQLAALLRQELAHPKLTAVSAALSRELLLCVLLALSRAAVRASPDRPAPNALARRFMAELEKQAMGRPTVEGLACTLRVSTSTLNRACKESFGSPAKFMIDRRVALEAQRLLVHTEATSVAIGEQLGFTEPTNFLKFFRRRVGTTPEAFRRAHRPGSAQAKAGAATRGSAFLQARPQRFSR
jgi:AraC-like DNA-binding protein